MMGRAKVRKIREEKSKLVLWSVGAIGLMVRWGKAKPPLEGYQLMANFVFSFGQPNKLIDQ